MNYGGAGAGPYGQPPMGGPAGVGAGPMRQQQAQMGAMPMQPGHPAAQQQRMMMAQRQMYPQQGMPGQPGMMPPQGHMGMYQQQQQHQMQKQQEMLSRFPPEWQQQITKEQNMEKRRGLFNHYMQKFQDVQNRQVMMSQGQVPPGASGMQGGMGPRGVAMYQGGPMPMGGMPPQGPNTMQHVPQSQQQQHMRIPSSSNLASQHQQQQQLQQGMVVSSAGMSQPPQMVMQSQATVPSPQVSALTGHSMASGSPAAANMHVPSPQVAHHQQPSTPLGGPLSVQQPGSVGDPGSQQPASVGPQTERSQEYENMRKELRDKYYDQLKRVGERCSMDNVPKPVGFDRLMEIIDNKRTVTIELLKRVMQSTTAMLDKQSLSYSVMCEVRRMAAEDADRDMSTVRAETSSNPSVAPDAWRSLRHMFVRVPDNITRLLNEAESSGAGQHSTKRSMEDTADQPPSKMFRSSGGGDSLSTSLLAGFRRHSRRGNSAEDEEHGAKNQQVDDASAPRIEIDCVFDGGRKWLMSVAASQELSDLPWRVDDECLPPSFRSPDVIICFDSQVLLCSPLRVLVPAQYPLESPVVQFDRSFPAGRPLSSQLATMFERSLSLASSRSLTCIYESFKTACQELVRLKGVHNGHYVPNKHQQNQLVA